MSARWSQIGTVPFASSVSWNCRSENFELLFAIGKIGAVAVPFDFHWSSQECRAMIDFLEEAAHEQWALASPERRRTARL